MLPNDITQWTALTILAAVLIYIGKRFDETQRQMRDDLRAERMAHIEHLQNVARENHDTLRMEREEWNLLIERNNDTLEQLCMAMEFVHKTTESLLGKYVVVETQLRRVIEHCEAAKSQRDKLIDLARGSE